MKYLILSCHTGQGHNACAEAIREAAVRRGDECCVKDALSFISPRFSAFISKSFVLLYRYLPRLFALCYTYVERHRTLLGESSRSYRALSRACASLHELCEKERYDVILCTHSFAALIVTTLKKTYGLSAKTAFVSTDYTCHPGVEASEIDLCLIPAPSLAEEFQANGVRATVCASGIPVRATFSERTDKAEARRRLGLPENGSHLLIMCGSMGCGPIPKLLRRIASAGLPNLTVTVICGTNRRLYRRLNKRYRHTPGIRIRGYETNVSLLMDSADLYLTKPGGISVTEAASKGLPMALIQAVAGCEAHNMRFFVRSGGAVGDSSAKRLAQRCMELLEAPEELARMSRLLEDSIPHGAADTVLLQAEQAGCPTVTKKGGISVEA